MSDYDERPINKGQPIYYEMSRNVVYLFSIYDEMTHNVVYLFSTPNLGNYQANMTISPLALNQSKLLKYFQKTRSYYRKESAAVPPMQLCLDYTNLLTSFYTLYERIYFV